MRAFLFTLTMLLWTWSVSAGSLDVGGTLKQSINIFQAQVLFPAPPAWFEDGDMASEDRIAKMSVLSKQTKDNSFILEQVPNGET